MTEEQEIQTDDNSEVKENDGATFETGAPEESETTGEDQETDGKAPEKLFNQEAANKAFIENKKKVRAAEEEAQKAKAEADELKAKLAKYEEGKRPEIPEMPDQFDDDYEEKVKARDEAIIKANEWDSKQFFVEQAKVEEQKKVVEKQLEQNAQILDTYNSRVKDIGLEEKEMIAKENIVDAYIKDPGLVRFLLSNEDGPLAIAYLAENPREMEKIAVMPTADAAVYVSTNVLPNAQKMKPETTKTPDPLYIPEGGGTTEQEENPLIKGATFE